MNEAKNKLEIWLDFAKALIRPAFVVLLLWIYGGAISQQLKDLIDKLEQQGGRVEVTKSGVSISVLAKQEAKDVQATVTGEARPAAPTDPAPTQQAISQVQRLAALQTLQGVEPAKSGWIYCGQLANGHWIKSPNLKVKGPLVEGQTYTIATSTYLRQSPPEGDTPKGAVIGVVPEGAASDSPSSVGNAGQRTTGFRGVADLGKNRK